MRENSKLYTQNEKKGYGLKNFNNKLTQKFFKNSVILILIMLICTMISMFFNHILISESDIVMVYLLGILLFSFLAEGYLYSFFASICVVLLYNFFFTEPYYTLKVNNPDYLITFLVMFIVGFITSMLTIRVKMERQLVEDKEEYISSLYYIERRLLNVKSVENLAKVSAEEISKQINANVLVEFFKPSGSLLCRNIEGVEVFSGNIDCCACLETYQSGSPCGRGTTLFPNAKAYYAPILSQNGVLGVIGVSLTNDLIITNTQRAFIDVIAPQIAVVLERERIYEKQKQAQMEIQAERLHADMLRSVSHDLRTPLAGIMGLASTALDNYDKLKDEVKKNFLQSIYEDADWLNELVENILQTTRFEEGRVKLNIQQEAAEEIITEAVTHVKKHALCHKIIVKIPDEIILLRVDGVLIRQVIVNILNNAINYSSEESGIIVSLYRKDNRVIFEVKDSGTGISQEDLPHIFERYFHKNENSIENRKGMGLGLSLCKSIIEAHNGKISIRKNEPHGTIVSFYFLSKKEII
ncbi:MAG: integral rane sensor signal transduction histidine kinase [Clostridiales bacterium]|jgi:two-component system sensor histidine kinase KdpD|nr:integral rane sensor signal transduction histidine kinase [Clostridiales bacterium]